MTARNIYASIIIGVVSGVVIGNMVSRNCCIDKGGNSAYGFLLGCLSSVGISSLIYIVSTESQRNFCSGCSKLVHRMVGDDDA